MRINYTLRKCGKGVWCYGEKGVFKLNQSKRERKGHSSLIFLHGIGADKDMWTSIIRNIPSNYYCILLDLPGHGETTFIQGTDQPKLDYYVKSLREFLEVTGLDKTKITLIG